MRWILGLSGFGVLCLALAATPSASAKDVLFLVGNRGNLNNFDPALKLRLEWQHAANVTVEQADAFDAQGLDDLARQHDLVLISESLGSTTTLDANNNNVFKLQNTPVPVISFEAYMWEDAFWSELPQAEAFGNTGRTDLMGAPEAAGLEAAQTDIFITATGAQHPLGAGFPEGRLRIHTQPYSVNFGTPSSDAKVIATADEAGEFPTYYIYETNDTLVDGSTVPAARIALFVGQAADPNANFGPMPEFFNDAALALIDAAFEFALGPKPTPGDVNRDGDINLDDFNVIASEFLTEGMTPADVNHDMKVDFTDFGLWKLNAQAGAGGQTLVPEPNGLWLLGIASLALGALRARRCDGPKFK